MGRYEGRLTVSWDSDGRHMELRDPFAFIDRAELRWDVPAGAQIDGASIPQFLWSITGSPYTGKYRDASVIHDWYCSLRTRSSEATHAMFHEAMRVSGVSATRAAIMYAAVRYAGPSWSAMDVHNANLATGKRWGPGERANRWGPGGLPPFGTDAYENFMVEEGTRRKKAIEPRAPSDATAEEFAAIARDIRAGKMDLEAIGRINAHRPEAKSQPLPGGVFRFSAENPLSRR